MTDKTPFDHWWGIYPGFRKKNKQVCREKFEKHPLEVQREIYKHTRDSITLNPDWRDQQYICAPEVYLNQQRWETPLPTKTTAGRPATVASAETDEQKARGLRKLQDAAASTGQDTSEIQKQIDALVEKFGGAEV